MSEQVGGSLRSIIGAKPARPNPYGAGTGIVGLAVGWFTATLLLDLWPRPAGRHLSNFTNDVLSLVGLWIGFLGAVGLARMLFRASGESAEVAATFRHEGREFRFWSGFRSDFGVAIRPIDVPIGIAAGLFGQYLLAPAAEAPLLPFVSHLYSRLNGPALSISHGVTGFRLAILGVLICLVGPAVEELYFRGLVFRGMLSLTSRLRGRLSVVVAVVLSSAYFAVVHLEPIVMLGLFAFGALLATLAWWTGRLGPGFIAHVTFNAIAFITLARAH